MSTKSAFVRGACVQLLAITVVLVLLLAKWAGAAEMRCDAYEAECRVTALQNGRVGEKVRTCDKVQLVCRALERKMPERRGTTTVKHIGR